MDVQKNAPAAKDIQLFLDDDLFRDVPKAHLEDVFSRCPVLELDSGEILLSPGEENHHLYLLLSGELLVYIDAIGSGSSFTLEAGEYTGEMSIIDDDVPSAFVVAEMPSRVLQIHEDLFWEEIAKYRSVLRHMLHRFSQRMRNQISLTVSSLEQQLRYEHLQRELEAAGKIQANILPQQTPLFPDHPQVDVCAKMAPAQQVSGDFYDAFPIDDDHICIAVGDVSGKGLPAALFMVRVVTLLRMSMLKRRNFNSVLPRINALLSENNPECNFVTIFLGMLNVKNGRLQYLNGGHNPPFIARNGQPFAPLPMPQGALLGFSDQATYDSAEIMLQPDDTLLLYTDGITEAENVQSEFFLEEKALHVLNQLKSTATVDEIVNKLYKAVSQFSKGVPPSDDMTLLALRFFGNE